MVFFIVRLDWRSIRIQSNNEFYEGEKDARYVSFETQNISKWEMGVGFTKNLYENRMCNQWDNWRAYGPELLL